MDQHILGTESSPGMEKCDLGKVVLRASQQPTRNPIDVAEKYPKKNKKKKQERKQTQYLTRFDNLPKSSG